ncbi:MAG: hypothetical protein KDE08_00480 [Rhodobacteraceae bacterium]|nr:hypothetical protein [Paracoccaceae bacterium]
MYDCPRKFHPYRVFAAIFLPLALLALALGVLAEFSAPGLAPLVYLAVGLAAFAFAADAAAAGKIPGVVSLEKTPPIWRVLEMRKNRLWYAFVFAATGVGFAVVAPVVLRPLGLSAPMIFSFGQSVLMGLVLMTAAWVVIGEAACSKLAVRRALSTVRDGL